MAIIQSLAIKNFQSIRERVLIEFKPLTLLYGPNSAGKSAILDALTMLGAVTHGTSVDHLRTMINRWTRREDGDAVHLLRAIELELTILNCRIWDETDYRDAIPPDVMSAAVRIFPSGGSVTFRIIFEDVTPDELFRHSGVETLELWYERRRVFRYDWEEAGLQMEPATWGEVICKDTKVNGTPYGLPANSTAFMSTCPLSRCTPSPGYGDDDGDRINAAGACALVNHFLEVIARAICIPAVVEADRSVIPNADLQVLGTAGYWKPGYTRTGQPRSRPGFEVGFAQSPIHKQELPRTLMTELALSQLEDHLAGQLKRYRTSLSAEMHAQEPESHHIWLGRELDQAIERMGEQHGESAIDFVNRCLSMHLFLDQAYQLKFDICEISPPATSASAEGEVTFWNGTGNIASLRNPEEQESIGWATSALLLGQLLDGKGRRMTFEDVGTGLSCVVPVLAALRTPFSFVQQPELHLHPALQSALGDVFVEVAHEGRVSLVETHSEYILLRILKRMRQTESGKQPESSPLRITPNQVNVLYFDPQPDGSTTVKRIRLTNDGDFADRWPRGFFEERGRDLFDE